MVEQDLRKQSARRVSDDDRRLVETVDNAPYVLDDGWEGQRLYGRGVLAQRLDLEARVGGDNTR
jgi:hypothetical protein